MRDFFAPKTRHTRKRDIVRVMTMVALYFVKQVVVETIREHRR